MDLSLDGAKGGGSKGFKRKKAPSGKSKRSSIMVCDRITLFLFFPAVSDTITMAEADGKRRAALEDKARYNLRERS